MPARRRVRGCGERLALGELVQPRRRIEALTVASGHEGLVVITRRHLRGLVEPVRVLSR